MVNSMIKIPGGYAIESDGRFFTVGKPRKITKKNEVGESVEVVELTSKTYHRSMQCAVDNVFNRMVSDGLEKIEFGEVDKLKELLESCMVKLVTAIEQANKKSARKKT